MGVKKKRSHQPVQSRGGVGGGGEEGCYKKKKSVTSSFIVWLSDLSAKQGLKLGQKQRAQV